MASDFDIGAPALEEGDRSGFSFGQRQRHFFNLYTGLASPKTADQLATWEGIAWRAAFEEMMDEQQAMLLAICAKLGL